MEQRFLTSFPDAISHAMNGLRTPDHRQQDVAYQTLMNETTSPVDWTYGVWDDLLGLLKAGDNRQRAIAAQVLCSLAKSDPKHRIRKDLAALIHTTRDESFVTARHTMQSLWKVGVLGPQERKLLVESLIVRFNDCAEEKNCTLIRYDILASMRKVYDETGDASLPEIATKLIEQEPDQKYQKKYRTLWRTRS